ncbi:hypothetical protein DFH07DRAFT_265909 [Mycena maculata]|uniref:F-box domain-containing protein n=1 Tax=Mycena maculata TaxID=230809 RepID=A0AAD7HN24_9AGAR|nr:hypothetical protein DFH07DRAFT_265909 [Mycena maculata]
MVQTGSTDTDSCVTTSFLQLPHELILLIYDLLALPELLVVYRVSSLAKQIALPVILERHGISRAQLESQELLNVPSRALRFLSAAHPTILPNIRVLELRFDEEIDCLSALHFLGQFTERFPVIPHVTLTFPDPPTTSDFWTLLPPALVALIGDDSKPAGIIKDFGIFVVRPSSPDVPTLRSNLFARAWRAWVSDPASSYTGPLAIPKIDKQDLIEHLSVWTSYLVSEKALRIQVQSFTAPAAPFGSFLVLASTQLCIDPEISAAEWHHIIPELDLPSLRMLFIHVDLDCDKLAVFLDNHHQIEHLSFETGWSCLHNHSLPPFSASALPRLKHLSANARIISRLLRTYEFPLLEAVDIGSTADNADSSSYAQAALWAVAAHPSVTRLKIDLCAIDPPWNDLEPGPFRSADDGMLQFPNVHEIRIYSWPHHAEHSAFPRWLTRFPSLRKLDILAPLGGYFWTGQLVAPGLVKEIKATFPHIVLEQEQSDSPLLEQGWCDSE